MLFFNLYSGHFLCTAPRKPDNSYKMSGRNLIRPDRKERQNQTALPFFRFFR